METLASPTAELHISNQYWSRLFSWERLDTSSISICIMSALNEQTRFAYFCVKKVIRNTTKFNFGKCFEILLSEFIRTFSLAARIFYAQLFIVKVNVFQFIAIGECSKMTLICGARKWLHSDICLIKFMRWAWPWIKMLMIFFSSLCCSSAHHDMWLCLFVWCIVALEKFNIVFFFIWLEASRTVSIPQ